MPSVLCGGDGDKNHSEHGEDQSLNKSDENFKSEERQWGDKRHEEGDDYEEHLAG